MSSHYVYVVRCAKGTYYTGYTNDLGKRIAAHNEGEGAKYLRGRGPVKLVYYGKCRSKNDALRAERAIKRLTRAEKARIVRA